MSRMMRRAPRIAPASRLAFGIPEIAPYQAWTDNGDGNVMLNVEVVPGLYYAADSAAVRSVAERRTPCA